MLLPYSFLFYEMVSRCWVLLELVGGGVALAEGLEVGALEVMVGS